MMIIANDVNTLVDEAIKKIYSNTTSCAWRVKILTRTDLINQLGENKHFVKPLSTQTFKGW